MVAFRAIPKNLEHYCNVLTKEIERIEASETLSVKQEKAISIAKSELAAAINAKSEIEAWSHYNIAQIERAEYLSEIALLVLLESDELRRIDLFDAYKQEKWQERLGQKADEIRSLINNGEQISTYHREFVRDFLKKVASYWNKVNQREVSKTNTLMLLSIVCAFILLIIVVLIPSRITQLAALFGATGGLISAMTTLHKWPFRNRATKLGIVTFLVKPLTGAIVAIVFLQFLISNISPIQIAPWNQSGTAIPDAWVAAVSFAAGFSERFILGKLDLSK